MLTTALMINKLQNRQPWSFTISLWYIYMFVLTPNIIAHRQGFQQDIEIRLPFENKLCNVYLVLITAFNSVIYTYF